MEAVLGEDYTGVEQHRLPMKGVRASVRPPSVPQPGHLPSHELPHWSLCLCRAVSGGAVYVSDKPGEHDFELLKRLVLPDGSVLRALLPGRPTRDTLFSDVLRDGTSVLKVCCLETPHRTARCGTLCALAMVWLAASRAIKDERRFRQGHWAGHGRGESARRH